MKLTSMQKIIIACVAIVIVAIVVVVLLILPMFATLGQLETERLAAEQQKQQADTLYAQLEEAKSRAASTQSEILMIGTQMPDSPQLPTLIIELQDMANQAGVTINTLSPEQPLSNATKNLTEIRVTLSVNGAQWSDLLDFMRRVNKSTRLLRVTDISVARAAVDAGSGSVLLLHKPATTLNVALTLKAYVIGINGQIAPATAPGAEGAPGAAAGTSQ